MSSNCSSSQQVAVSAIVPCRNEADTIEESLRSILDQEPCEGGFEIIVADGQSTDRTCDIVRRIAREDHRIRLIENPGRIVSTGLNVGVRAAQGSIIIRMDAHTLYARDYVCQCLSVLRQTRADNVGGPARTLGNGYVQAVISAAYHSAFAVGGARFHDPTHEGYVDTVPYGCWLREVFDRIGFFDEELVRNQDDEFNLRLTRTGGRIWQSPRIRSWYRTRGSIAELFKQYRQYGYWKVRVIQKHKLPASIRHVVPACFLLALMAMLLASMWWAPALAAFISFLALYFVCNCCAAVITARKKGWVLLPLLPVVFATYHISYGLGFLRGIWDFVVVRQRPQPSLISLSRESAAE